MGRPLKGPVKINAANQNWFARLTVKPADRARAGCNRLTRSLGTSDYSEAMRRWPAAYQALQEELSLRLAGTTDPSLIRARLPLMQIDESLTPDTTALSHKELAELVLNTDLDPKDPLHRNVYESISSGAAIDLTWSELLSTYQREKDRKRGRPVSPSTLKNIRQAIKSIEPIQPFPAKLTKQEVRQLIGVFEASGLKPKTISVKCGLLQSLIQTGIECDAIDVTVNPFTLVSFSGATREEDRRRAFDLRTELPILKTSKYWPIFRLLIGSSMRIGEVWSRRNEDFDGNIVIIRDNPSLKWRPKTASSYRRIPLDSDAMAVLKDLLPVSSVQGFEKRLRDEVRRLFPFDTTLTVHSTRHTFKSLSRMVGMPADISDEIDGHKKTTVSAVSDAYGHYPDEVLALHQGKVWGWLS
jgi:integrase